MEQQTQPENKIRLAIDFMRAALSQEGSPNFKEFWEARRLCLPLFKETLQAKERSELWAAYAELSSEARHLKERFDEESAFATQQIELAIDSLEKEIDRYDELLLQIPEVEFPEPSQMLADKKQFYRQLQRELNLLNVLASRINSLRKEVVKTSMRLKVKSQFFEKLSQCGDRIFPRRKELIQQVSDQFSSDVDLFIDYFFKEPRQDEVPLFVLRDEIKALQALAKMLTLSTEGFKHTRLKLSDCWDKLREWDKERKKEFAERKEVFKKNFDVVMEKINSLAELCLQEGISEEKIAPPTEEIFALIRESDLGRDEVKKLKEELAKARRPIVEKGRLQELERQQEEQERIRKRAESLQQFKGELTALFEKVATLDLESLLAERNILLEKYEALSLKKAERQLFDRLLKQLKDVISEKKEKAVLSLSEEDLESFEQLKSLLKERKEQRQEIKNQLEAYRKALGGSGFDFEKAMMYRELMETEKTALEKANATIQEIEEKIDKLEGN